MEFLKKWYIYQKERFPVLKYGAYIFVIIFGEYCFINWLSRFNSSNLSSPYLIETSNAFKLDWKIVISMFMVAFLQFLMVRIIDEFKDYEEDCKYRAYRPVPRGLITLKELKILFIICALLQICITAFINIKGIVFLLIVWAFFAIMSKVFFIKKILDKHILLEVALDELLMPILVIYLSTFSFENMSQLLTSCYYYIFLVMTYVISWIVEIARKVRCKEEEETGVKTYTAVFGIIGAMFILFILQLLLFVLQTVLLGKERIFMTIFLFAIVSVTNLIFAIKQNKKFSKITELSANIYVFVAYLSMTLLVI